MYNDAEIRDIVPEIVNNTIKLSKKITENCIKKLSLTIDGIENIMHENYGIEWAFIDSADIQRPLKFFEWEKSPIKNPFREKLFKLF